VIGFLASDLSITTVSIRSLTSWGEQEGRSSGSSSACDLQSSLSIAEALRPPRHVPTRRKVSRLGSLGFYRSSVAAAICSRRVLTWVTEGWFLTIWRRSRCVGVKGWKANWSFGMGDSSLTVGNGWTLILFVRLRLDLLADMVISTASAFLGPIVSNFVYDHQPRSGAINLVMPLLRDCSRLEVEKECYVLDHLLVEGRCQIRCHCCQRGGA
jgi:hypothetical protein